MLRRRAAHRKHLAAEAKAKQSSNAEQKRAQAKYKPTLARRVSDRYNTIDSPNFFSAEKFKNFRLGKIFTCYRPEQANLQFSLCETVGTGEIQ